MYVPNKKVSKYVRQKLKELQREIDESTVIIGGFNTPLLEMDRSIRQKISKAIIEINNTVNQLAIIDIYSLVNPIAAEYTFLSSSHESS